MEYLNRQTLCLSVDQNEMFVLMSLLDLCLRCVIAPFNGMNRPPADVNRALLAAKKIVQSTLCPLVPLHVPRLRLFT